MLKIKDGIPLVILKSYGFKLYDKFKRYSIDIDGADMEIELNSRKIKIITYDADKYLNIGVLYDLIEDGLVEKVEDK